MIDANLRVFRRRPIVDQESGRAIGWARGPRIRTMLSISDLDDHEVLLRVTYKRHRWTAHALDHEIAIVPTVRRGENRTPWTWTGWVLDGGERELAYISQGTVVAASDRTPMATLTVQSSRWRNDCAGTWTIRIKEDAGMRYRIAALAWLGIAFDLQFARDWLDD